MTARSNSTASTAASSLISGRLIYSDRYWIATSLTEWVPIPDNHAWKFLNVIAKPPYSNCRLADQGLPVFWDGKRVMLRVKP